MPRRKTDWLAHEIHRLKQFRDEGASYRELSYIFKRHVTVIMRKCRELGLNQHMNRGRTPGRIVRSETMGEVS